jgi:hypothetical protein
VDVCARLCAPVYRSCPGKGVYRHVWVRGIWDGTRRDERTGRIGCVKVKVEAHVRQTAGGSGAIRRYGRRAVNGEAARKRGCGKGKDVRMKPRRIKARQGRPRATSRSNVDERQGMVVRG